MKQDTIHENSHLHNLKVLYSNLFIAGGGLGGCAATLFAAQHGLTVVLIEPCDWIGGQISSQGVSALDEHPYIESFGGTRNYYHFRSAIREFYRPLLRHPQAIKAFNPGNCWVSRLAFEPRVGVKILYELMHPFLGNGQVKIFTGHQLLAATTDGDEIKEIYVQNNRSGEIISIRANIYLDASELGDLLSLVGAAYRLGAESRSETDEPHAADHANPKNVQSFTFPFIVQYCPGESHIIPKPPNYEYNRDTQPYSLKVEKGAAGRPVIYKMFAKTEHTPGSFWSYRRLIDAAQFHPQHYPFDLSMINWYSNDFRGGSIIDVPETERKQLLQAAKNLSLGFLYWLQTEAPRDDCQGRGYPELRLVTDALGTEDGLSQFPYIRESRRIKALQMIREQDIVSDCQPHARARIFPNSVGIGSYWLDIHKSKYEDSDFFTTTKPFQIPLGALIPQNIVNLVAGAKNIGTTHLSNGAYRLHPIEWAIGEAAAALALLAIKDRQTAKAIYHSPLVTAKLQMVLVESGVPIFWLIDVPQSHPAFTATQWLTTQGIVPYDEESLDFHPQDRLDATTIDSWLSNLKGWIDKIQAMDLEFFKQASSVFENIKRRKLPSSMTKGECCLQLYQPLCKLLYQSKEAYT